MCDTINNINWLAVAMEMELVSCEVRTETQGSRLACLVVESGSE
jgi:hypothetical protein